MIPEGITVNNRFIEARKIKAVFIKGYFKPVIGIKTQGNLFVPYKYCFSIVQQENQGINELTEWANQRLIKVAHKQFKRWL